MTVVINVGNSYVVCTNIRKMFTFVKVNFYDYVT